jgi:NTE family protein
MAALEPQVKPARFRSTQEAGQPAEKGESERRGFGLCLSGGGYRATLYHLGAARRLHELGALNRVDTISSVSGGSIFAAKLADLAMERGWQDGLAIENFDEVAERVRSLTSHDLRTTSMVWPGPGAKHLQHLLHRYGTNKQLRDLPKRPDFIFCATDMTYGICWEFSRTMSGSYDFRNAEDPDNWPVAFAVAASACFPPLFRPLPVHSKLLRVKKKTSRRAPTPDGCHSTALSDGGVYDNLGLEPVWKKRAQVLVSDAGAPLVETPYRWRPIKGLLRYGSVARSQTRALRLRIFWDQLNSDVYDGAYWDIGASARVPAVGYPKELIEEEIQWIRTDLDRFTDEEQMILENHGYWSVEDQFRKEGIRDSLGAILADTAHKPKAPHKELMAPDRVCRALRHSRSRFWLPRMLHLD